MVRLKCVQKPIEDVNGVIVFQFHYGSIKIDENLMQSWQFFISFNSTMVRLKYKGFAQRVNIKMFQFHYGSIKISGEDIKAVLNVFQFHYGSIKIFGR